MKIGDGLKRIRRTKPRWWIAGAALLAAVVMIAMPDKKEKRPTVPFDPATMPTMLTHDAHSLISDSGYTRYLIEAPVWEMFDEADEPFWRFSQGLYLEKYGDSMEVTATFVCDSAIYKSQVKLWEFMGNVRVNNELGDKFLTRQMYWDGNTHRIYSDSFIHIERQDRIIEGYGFESNEHVTDYTVNRPSMIIPVSDFTDEEKGGDKGEGKDSGNEPSASQEQPDSAAAKPAPRRVHSQRRQINAADNSTTLQYSM